MQCHKELNILEKCDKNAFYQWRCRVKKTGESADFQDFQQWLSKRKELEELTSFSEIARALKMPYGSVVTAYYVGMRKLKRLLVARGICAD